MLSHESSCGRILYSNLGSTFLASYRQMQPRYLEITKLFLYYITTARPVSCKSFQAILATMNTSDNTVQHLKRKRSADGSAGLNSGFDGPSKPKRPKSSLLQRYLIGCAHLLYVKHDSRERDNNENIIPVPVSKQAVSDLSQRNIVALYFDNMDRSMVSQCKSKSHLFAPPDWSIMEAYLFPWIRFNTTINALVKLTRLHIKHVAFRIWECLVTRGSVVLKYEEEFGQRENVPLGDVRGWWWETDGDIPRNYDAWIAQDDGSIPGT